MCAAIILSERSTFTLGYNMKNSSSSAKRNDFLVPCERDTFLMNIYRGGPDKENENFVLSRHNGISNYQSRFSKTKKSV